MNKNAIKKFAIEARKKLIDSVSDKAGMLGITEKSCSEPITKGVDFEVYQTVAGTEVTLNKRQCEQRRRLVSQIHSRGFEAVVEEVAYTWFNRICAIRFMEVNDYLPNRVRVLSSEKEGKMEPDLVTLAPDVDLDLTAQEKEEIINWKLSGTSEDTDKLYCKLFLKQCHQLHDILPGLFEADSDYMELLFGISYTNKDDVIYMLVNPDTGIPENDFNVSAVDEEGNPTGQVEIIGWLYQYYNTELKDDTFAKLKNNIKITKERIPAATQLFTPDWIVRYMVENSVGRIWIEHLRAVDPSTDEKATAERFGWKYYLPEAEQEDAVNVKLAEIRSTYKDLKPTDITCIDPCMGSGHILIAMFDVLMDIYESAGYDKREAAFEIVENNIHGLDIDKRAYQLAYFAVMMKGRGYNRRFWVGRNESIIEPMVYCFEESNSINRCHLNLFGNSLEMKDKKQAENDIKDLLDIFENAREYGSAIAIKNFDWKLLEEYIDDLELDGQLTFENVNSDETQKQIRKILKIAKNLNKTYCSVVTNPPYMSSFSMSPELGKYVKKEYPNSKSDLFSVMLEKCVKLLRDDGFVGMISMHSWMFLLSFEELRKQIISNCNIINMIHLGIKAFDEIGNDVVQTTSFIIRKKKNKNYKGTYFRLLNHNRCEKQKEFMARENMYIIKQSEFMRIPGNPIAYWLSNKFIDSFANNKIGDYGKAKQGLITGDNNTFLRLWHEVTINSIAFGMHNRREAQESGLRWFPYNKGGDYRKWYGNNNYVVLWENDGYVIQHFVDNKGKLRSRPQNMDYYFQKGITWSSITTGSFSCRCYEEGFLFDSGANGLFIDNSDYYIYILGLLNTTIAATVLKIINPTINNGPGSVEKIPVKIEQSVKRRVELIVEQNLSMAKNDWDSYEKSWDFCCHPLITVISKNSMLFDDINNIDLAECYICWENECNEQFNCLKANEEELNSIFIDIYGLRNELTPKVEDKDVTVSRADVQRDIKSLISYAVGCMFGRYSLDKAGLAFAGGEWDDGIYTTFKPDADNIIPITDEEYQDDDIVTRFCEWVKIVFGYKSLEKNLDFIAKALGNKGNTSRDVIRDYFLNDFYKDHCTTYSVTGSGKRPIYWLFDSGKQNGFKALIYMHRYDADTVGRVRTDYLHRAQKYVETAMQSAQYTIDNATSNSEKSKATKAVTKYTKQLAEMKIYDEAIAHIANKRIEIDLDDGVKVNYEKFQGVEVAQEGKKSLKVDLLAKIK